MEAPDLDDLDRLIAAAGPIADAMTADAPLREPDPTVAAILTYFESRLPAEGLVADGLRLTMRQVAGLVPPPADDPAERAAERTSVVGLIQQLAGAYELEPWDIFTDGYTWEDGPDDPTAETGDPDEEDDPVLDDLLAVAQYGPVPLDPEGEPTVDYIDDPHDPGPVPADV